MRNPFKDIVKVDHLPQDQEITDMPNSLFAFIWFFVRQVKWPLIIMFVISATASGLDALGPYFIKILVDAFQTVNSPQDIWDEFGIALYYFIIFFLIAQPVLSRLSTAIMAEIRVPFMNMMRRQLSLYMGLNSFNYFQNDFSGRLSSKVLETPYAIMQIVFTLLTSLSYALITFVVSFSFLQV